MNLEEIQEQLPDVIVRIEGVDYTGRVRGRNDRFATVSVEIRPNVWMDISFSWEAIERHLNIGMPLRS